MTVYWEVFENPDADTGGWFSYIENETNYIGGELHRTKAEAEVYGRKVAAEYNDGIRPLPVPPRGSLIFIYEATKVES